MDAEDEETNFGSQDDALLHQAYDAFEAMDNVSTAQADKNSVMDSRPGSALYKACTSYGEPSSTVDHSTTNGNSDNPETGASSTSEDTTGTSPDFGFAERRMLLPKTTKYLTVTKLVSQLWCEQQMVYNLCVPPEMLGELTEVDSSKIDAGSKIHLDRDHAVNTYVNVDVKTREDAYGIRLINMNLHLKSLLMLGKACIRELPVIGMPLGKGFVVSGTIDELRFNAQDRLELVELKTRADVSKRPSRSQMDGYRLQVMLYKQMLDELAWGLVDGGTVLKQLGLDSNQVLNEELLTMLRELGIDGVTLGELTNAILKQFQFLPHVQVLSLEFVSQVDKSSVSKETLDFDSDWLEQQLSHCLSFWREAQGVDIEEAWKCRFCAFSDMCEWRMKMNEICAQKNRVGKIQQK